MFQCSQQIGVVGSRELHCVGPVSIGKHRKVYCEVLCIRGMWIAQRIRYLITNNDVLKVVVILVLLFFFLEDRNYFFLAFFFSEITTFRKSSLFFLFLTLLFSAKQKIIFISCILLEITTFWKSSLFVFYFALFFRRTEILFWFLHFIRNNDFPNVVVIFGFALFFWRTGNRFFLALLVSIDHSHSVSQHKPSQKFNMCDFVASSQAFVAKAVIACDYWCPYILRHRALLCVLLTHVWKPGLSLWASTLPQSYPAIS